MPATERRAASKKHFRGKHKVCCLKEATQKNYVYMDQKNVHKYIMDNLSVHKYIMDNLSVHKYLMDN